MRQTGLWAIATSLVAGPVVSVAAEEPWEASASFGYALRDPSTYDETLRIEKQFDKDRSVRQCYCGDSRHGNLWQHFHGELHSGLVTDPSFRGEWVHRLCGTAYPVIFRAIQVDPADDTFVMHTDCAAGVVAMVAVCAQSSALMHLQSKAGIGDDSSPMERNKLATKREDDTGPWRSASGSNDWYRAARVVREEGMPVSDILGAVPLEECLAQCEKNPQCQSVAHGPHGCHLKSRCINSHDALVPESAQPEEYHTYFRDLCQGSETQEGIPGSPAAVQRHNTHLEELQNMMTFAIRALEFCFHCLDASPWPFLLAEILQNYALATETPEDYFWQRAAGRVAGESSKLGYGSNEMDIPSLSAPTDPEALRALPPVRLVLMRFQVRWTRGLESEATFWRGKLSFDAEENNSLDRLHKWLKTGEVTWFYDDPCTWFTDVLERGAAQGAPKRAPRFLNAGSGPFAPRPVRCMVDPKHLPTGAKQSGRSAGAAKVPVDVPVIAADGLGRFYMRVMDENGMVPLHTPLHCPVEDLQTCFPPSYFDVVHIRNALDHTFDPLLGIERMLRVVRPGGWVLLRHARNEGVAGKFRNGLHQWSFDTAGDGPSTSFVIWNPELRVDVSHYLLDSGLAAEVRTELRDHPAADAPPDEKYVWVDIRRPTIEEDARRQNSLSE